MEQLGDHPFAIIAIISITALVLFWNFAPTGTVSKSLNFVGNALQRGVAWLKSKL